MAKPKRLTYNQLYRLAVHMSAEKKEEFRALLNGLDDPTEWYRQQPLCSDCKTPNPPQFCYSLCFCKDCRKGRRFVQVTFLFGETMEIDTATARRLRRRRRIGF